MVGSVAMRWDSVCFSRSGFGTIICSLLVFEKHYSLEIMVWRVWDEFNVRRLYVCRVGVGGGMAFSCMFLLSILPFVLKLIRILGEFEEILMFYMMLELISHHFLLLISKYISCFSLNRLNIEFNELSVLFWSMLANWGSAWFHKSLILLCWSR